VTAKSITTEHTENAEKIKIRAHRTRGSYGPGFVPLIAGLRRGTPGFEAAPIGGRKDRLKLRLRLKRQAEAEVKVEQQIDACVFLFSTWTLT